MTHKADQLNPLRVCVLGGGSWATTVASLVCENAPTTLWARSQSTVDEINSQHTNSRYLGDAKLPESLSASHSIQEAVSQADVVVMGIPSQGFRQVLTEVAKYIRHWVPVISLTKGMEQGSKLRMTEIISEVLPSHPYGVLTGPNLAKPIMNGQPAASVIAVDDDVIVGRLQKLFTSGRFRVYTNTDVVGCEIAGTLKNPIAIATGMCDGIGMGVNERSAIITRGLAELTRLGVALGGKAETFAGLAGMGDLVATCTSSDSRNRYVGERLGQGQSLESIIEEMNQVAEGVKSCKVITELASQQDVQMPIIEAVFRVVHEQQSPLKSYLQLLRLEAGSEDEPA